MLWVNTVNWAGSPTDSSSTKLPVTLLRPSSDNSRLWICKVVHSINSDAEFEYFFLRSFYSLKEGSSRNEASHPASHFPLISAKLHSPQHPCSNSSHSNLIHTLTHYLIRNYHTYLHGKEQPRLINNKLQLTGYHLTYCETFYCQHLSDKIQGEHKVFPWLRTFITRKIRRIQTYFFYHYLTLRRLMSYIYIWSTYSWCF